MANNSIGTISGFRVYEDLSMVVIGGFDEVKMTWKDRLKHFPFNLFVKTRSVPWYKPDPDVAVDESKRAVYGHPDTIRRAMEEINKNARK